jgi:hypothetical protein
VAGLIVKSTENGEVAVKVEVASVAVIVKEYVFAAMVGHPVVPIVIPETTVGEQVIQHVPVFAVEHGHGVPETL